MTARALSRFSLLWTTVSLTPGSVCLVATVPGQTGLSASRSGDGDNSFTEGTSGKYNQGEGSLRRDSFLSHILVSTVHPLFDKDDDTVLTRNLSTHDDVVIHSIFGACERREERNTFPKMP